MSGDYHAQSPAVYAYPPYVGEPSPESWQFWQFSLLSSWCIRRSSCVLLLLSDVLAHMLCFAVCSWRFHAWTTHYRFIILLCGQAFFSKEQSLSFQADFWYWQIWIDNRIVQILMAQKCLRSYTLVCHTCNSIFFLVVTRLVYMRHRRSHTCLIWFNRRWLTCRLTWLKFNKLSAACSAYFILFITQLLNIQTYSRPRVHTFAHLVASLSCIVSSCILVYPHSRRHGPHQAPKVVLNHCINCFCALWSALYICPQLHEPYDIFLISLCFSSLLLHIVRWHSLSFRTERTPLSFHTDIDPYPSFSFATPLAFWLCFPFVAPLPETLSFLFLSFVFLFS